MGIECSIAAEATIDLILVGRPRVKAEDAATIDGYAYPINNRAAVFKGMRGMQGSVSNKALVTRNHPQRCFGVNFAGWQSSTQMEHEYRNATPLHPRCSRSLRKMTWVTSRHRRTIASEPSTLPLR